jgi:hypothetical protein
MRALRRRSQPEWRLPYQGAFLASVSCGSAGNCAAGGIYTDGSGHQQGFVVSQA